MIQDTLYVHYFRRKWREITWDMKKMNVDWSKVVITCAPEGKKDDKRE